MFTTALFIIVKIGSNLEIYEKENGQQKWYLHTMEHYTTIKQHWSATSQKHKMNYARTGEFVFLLICENK